MATSVTETERKYEAPSDASLPDLTEITGVATGPEEFDLEATYFDTGDYRLARAGVTLRRRVGGEDEGWHLKLPAGEDSRQEVRVPLGRAVKTPPEDLSSLVRAHTRGQDLAPVAEIRTNRRRWQLSNGDGDMLAEVVDDVVTAQTMGSSTTTSSWREIEVELGERGDRKLLDTVEHHLGEAGIHPSKSSSKLSQVIGVKRDAVPAVSKKSTAGEVVLAYLHEQRAALQNQDPRVRRNEDDAIHQMRVATRRMRSALQAFGKIVDREATRSLTDELKWLASVLGTSRDLEVLRMRFEDALHALPPELVLGDVAARMTRYFAPLEAKAHNDSVAALDSKRYFTLLNDIDALLTNPPFTKQASGKAKDVLPRLVEKARRRLDERVQTALATGDSDEPLHEARKAAKRLRYSSEVAEPALGKHATALRQRAKDVQTLLGEHQDSVVARPVLFELGRGDENGFTFGVLYGKEVELAHKTEAELPALWHKLGKEHL
ncbi:Inorganic triphosphatase YgiF, contains CYTH and CHAD domains [Lentzea xinjiangensis]|uniref:Inorganic triphosphatase YgiF, contains CYTH and CHAD domains n=1 Tax=Lentzea xinjiangensis TaxID=402600 RepID=A0A1H9VA26_9PSEU|nr:CYTH and CHAD domain-containing protein [Lentzea xinjiangensis]SES18274.1 Inorganic triphosphatase YgiF, contains CYTH and CHAD domains [Lentzea xinjiangensis]